MIRVLVMRHDTLQTAFFFVLLTSVFVLSFLIFQPYLGALAIAAVFTVIFYPFYTKVLRWVRGRESLAALITTICIFLIVVLPFSFFGYQLFQEAQGVYLKVTNSEEAPSSQLVDWVQTSVQRVAPGNSFNINQYVQQALEWLIQRSGSFFASTARVVLNTFLSLITLFFLLRDGHKLKKKIMDVSPLKDFYDQRIFDRLAIAVNSVVKGSLIVAITQGAVTGIGLAIFGVPNAVLWGSVTVLAALVPSVGTALVLVPAIIFLFLTNHLVAAVGLLIWGVIFVASIDNFLGPRLINKGIRIHPMVVLLAVIGGLHFFGAIGYIMGPVTISFLFALIDIYPLLVPKDEDAQVG